MAFTASVQPAAGSGTNIADVVVNFGDGTRTSLGPVSGTNVSIHHVYVLGGTYNVTLTATDTNGGVGVAATSVFVQSATPLTVLLSATATPSPPNTTETFTATVLGLGNSVVVNYHWIFGSTLGAADTTSNTITRSCPAGAAVTVTVVVATSTLPRSGSTLIIVRRRVHDSQ